MTRSISTRSRSAEIFVLLFVLAIGACDSTESATSAPSPEATTATTTTTTVPASSTTTATTTTTTATVPASSTTTPPDDHRTLAVPAQAHPVVDGVLDAGEWDGSTTVTMTDASSVHWMYEDDVIYVALESTAIGAVNLLIATEDEVWILHSSAALGSALYLPADGMWELSHGFDWCCRSATNESSRLQLLDEEGWQANIGFTGDDGIVEYEVTLPWNGALVAVSYLTDTETSAFWPADLSSEARDQLVGPPPPERNFNLDEWYTLVSIEG